MAGRRSRHNDADHVQRVVAVRVPELARAIRASLPTLSLRAQAIIDALLLTGGSIGTSQQVAQLLGLRNRFELARLLKHEGLPPLQDLAGWAALLGWVDCAERTGSSMCQLAFLAHKDPAACYRLVKRLTGLHWREIRFQGSAWVLQGFVARCGAKTIRSTPRPRAGTAHSERSALRMRPQVRSVRPYPA